VKAINANALLVKGWIEATIIIFSTFYFRHFLTSMINLTLKIFLFFRKFNFNQCIEINFSQSNWDRFDGTGRILWTD
jgi:hypothetical protein